MRIFILFPIIFVNFFLYSQKRNSIFCFADSVLIRFDQDTFYIEKSNLSLIPAPPQFNDTIIPQSLNEGTAAICDKFGNLKYYTDGINLFNGNHILIESEFKGIAVTSLPNNYILSPTIAQGSLFLSIDNDYFLLTNSSQEINFNKIVDDNVIIKNNLLFKGKIYEAQNAIRHANGRDFNYYFFESKIKSNIKGDTIILHKFIITPESIYKINNEIFFTADIDIDIFYYYAILLFNSNFGFAYFAPYLQRRDNGVMKLSFNRKNADLIIDSIITKLTKSEWFGTAIGLSKNGIISAHRKMNLDTFEEIISHYNLLNDSLIIIDTIYGLAIGLINPMHSDSLFYLLMHGNRNLDNGEVYSDIYKYDLNTKNFRKFTIRDKRFWGDVLFTNYTPHDLRPELEIGFKHQLLACNDTCYGGQRIAFTDTSCCHFYRIWDFGDGTVSDTLWVTQHAELLNKVDTFQTVTHAYARPGRYKVTLQILNPYDYGEHLPPGQFLKDTLEKWIDVPFCSKADFTSQSSCNQTVTILDKHCGGYDSLMYDYGDGSPLTTSNTHTYAQPGVYYVTQILKLDTFVSRFTSPVIVPDCIYPDVSLKDTLCVFDTLKVVYNGTSNYDTLWYSVEPLQGVKDIRQNLVSFERSGEYRLWLHAANTTFDTTWFYPNTIVVLDCDELWIPNAFTPNKDGLNDVFNYVCRNCVWHSLEIFNRDTQPIFRCEGSETCVWLGKTEKGFVSEGVYVYRLKVRKRDGNIVERVGTVTVMK